ncbi:hypothetical protein HK096_008520 [Nowakowskiella sp. JEL0078]|nr:hypothetical protein HK096_008520 [Nowakowskiella sp. JEL0078]
MEQESTVFISDEKENVDSKKSLESSATSWISREASFFWQNFTLTEMAGALGDIGTFLPILVSLAVTSQINISSTLVFAGIFRIVTGFMFKITMPLQPMKSIAAIALVAKLTLPQVVASGFFVSCVVAVLSACQALHFANRLLPLSLVRGIQLGTGLQLITKGVALILASHAFTFTGYAWTDNHLTAVIAFIFTMCFYMSPKNYSALILFGSFGPGMWTMIVPTGSDFAIGIVKAGLGQLPLSILNSVGFYVIAMSKLADDLYPQRKQPVASITAVGVSVGVMNIVGMWFGSMPFCLGSGGLAAQYRFGARTHVSVVILGIVKIVLGLVFGSALLPIFQNFPQSVLGVMLVFAGIEIATCAKDIGGIDESAQSRFVVVLVTGGVASSWANDGVGFVAGVLACFVLFVSELVEKKENVWKGILNYVKTAWKPRN